MTRNRQQFVLDLMIDHMLAEPRGTSEPCTLKWDPTKLKLLECFKNYEFKDLPKLEKLKEFLKDPVASEAARRTEFLDVWNTALLTPEDTKWIRSSFTNVTRLDVWVGNGWDTGLSAFHDLFPNVKSLVVKFDVVRLTDLSAFLCSFSKLEYLCICGEKIEKTDEDGNYIRHSTPRVFTGTLKLKCGLEGITSLFSGTSIKPCFQNISWKINPGETNEATQWLTVLVESCSSTLKSITIRHYPNNGIAPASFGSIQTYSGSDDGVLPPASPPVDPVDLSKATSLEGVVLQYDLNNPQWLTRSLEKLPSENKSFEQISIRLPTLAGCYWETYPLCTELDDVLVRLSDSGKIRTKAIYTGGEERMAEGFVERVFPKMRKRGKLELIVRDISKYSKSSSSGNVVELGDLD